MISYSRSHLSDHTLLLHASSRITRERSNTAELLADLAEIEVRSLYLAAGYPSMLAFCVQSLQMPEDSALKRIRAARAAREFPVLFAAVADGRIHLSGVLLLKPYLKSSNINDLLNASANKSNSGIEKMLAERYPSSEELPMVVTIPVPEPANTRPALEPPVLSSPDSHENRSEEQRPRAAQASVPRAKVAPIASQRFAIHLTIGRDTHAKLSHVRDLLSHQIPSGELSQILDRVLDLAIAQLERKKFAATSKPKTSQARANHPRTIPAHVRRAVRERDGHRCTFIGIQGHRCAETRFLEFDHVLELARGGTATLDGIRLRCRAHNQYTAEQTFGAEFMREKRRAR